MVLALLFLLLFAPAAQATPDPYNSFMWDYRKAELLGAEAQAVFDPRVRVVAPGFAEDPFQVPVMVDASGLGERVEQIVVFVDYGPIPRILTYHPGQAEPRLSLRFKIDQATPVRAAALTESGVWHVGSAWVDATGGGCAAPAVAYATEDWPQTVGQVQGRVWATLGRVRAVVRHPMDTGLAPGIPVFILEDLRLSTPDGFLLAQVELGEPVSEDPAFTFYFAPQALPPVVGLTGRDSSGTVISAVLQDGAED